MRCAAASVRCRTQRGAASYAVNPWLPTARLGGNGNHPVTPTRHSFRLCTTPSLFHRAPSPNQRTGRCRVCKSNGTARRLVSRPCHRRWTGSRASRPASDHALRCICRRPHVRRRSTCHRWRWCTASTRPHRPPRCDVCAPAASAVDCPRCARRLLGLCRGGELDRRWQPDRGRVRHRRIAVFRGAVAVHVALRGFPAWWPTRGVALSAVGPLRSQRSA